MPRLEFWYEFASNYSYLSVMRSRTWRGWRRGHWRPFLLGPIFKSQGWDTSPFNLYPVKGRYMIRDMQRLAESRGLPFVMPPTFPANGLKAARLALIGADEGWIEPFTRAVFEAEFGRGEDIAQPAVIEKALSGLGLDSASLLARAEEPEIKQRLKDQRRRPHLGASRCAELHHGGWRAVLGRRPPGAGTRLGRRLTPEIVLAMKIDSDLRF